MAFENFDKEFNLRTEIVARNYDDFLDRAESDWEGDHDQVNPGFVRAALEEAYDEHKIENPFQAMDYVLEKAKRDPTSRKSHEEIMKKRNRRFANLPPALKKAIGPRGALVFLEVGKLPKGVSATSFKAVGKPVETPRQALAKANEPSVKKFEEDQRKRQLRK